MKLHKILLVFAIPLLVLIGCANPELSIKTPSLTTSDDGIATIKGKTNPNGTVNLTYDKVGFGDEDDIIELETQGDENGNFEFDVDWQTTYYLQSKINGKTSEEKTVTVEHPKEEKQTTGRTHYDSILSEAIEAKEKREEKELEDNKKDIEQEEHEKNIPREHENALRSAENYLNIAGLSKEGLFEQLISYDEFPEEAARYAVENINTDWDNNALRSAENYLDVAGLSDQKLYDQLIEYDGFTEEQAQYAIDNLD